MQRFLKVFKQQKCNIIAMIHVDALPGTPLYAGNWRAIVEKAQHEAHVYQKCGVDAVMLENMHDVPYVQEQHLGPETVACMTRLAHQVRTTLPSSMPCGVQLLASGNRQALAVAAASEMQFIRAEGFVFGHVADEGYTDACAGQLMRYRRHIDAQHILIFTDIKKKHSAHSITGDVTLLETAHAAEFFLTDGIIITGTATGHATDPKDLTALAGRIRSPILIGSGVTCSNLGDYITNADAAIVGSHFKVDSKWQNEVCESRIAEFMARVRELRG